MGSRKKPKKNSADNAQLSFVWRHSTKIFAALITAGAVAIVSAYVSPRWARLLTQQKHAVIGGMDFQLRHEMPDCGVLMLSIVPAGDIKALNLQIRFDHEIRSHIIQDQLNTGQNFGLSTHVRIDRPCDIVTPTSDRNENLTFSVTPDNRQIIIRGRDISQYDAQSLVATFYPNPWGDHPELDIRGTATYEAFGNTVKAKIKLYDTITHQLINILQ